MIQTSTQNVNDRSSVVLGLGATGLSCLDYLNDKVSLVACDDHIAKSRQQKLQARYPKVKFLNSEECLQLSLIHEVIASPGISDAHPVIAKALHQAIPVVCDIEIYARAERKPVIAITGTNGKSTVVSWLAHVLNTTGRDCALAGNIGVPALDILNSKHDCCVLELSSFQLERTFSLAPVAALILNLSSDHLDRYHSIQDYQTAKERVYRNAEMAILNRDALTFNLPESIHTCISFGLDESSKDFGVLVVDGKRFLSFAGKPLLASDTLPLIGEHNVSNALAVLACGSAMGIKPEAALDGLISFKGLPHRTELVDTIKGVRYINDSKATNAGATLAAVRGDLENIILIAGGDAKKAELGALADALKGKLKASILLGKDADTLEALLSPIASCSRVNSIEQAVTLAHEIACSGDTVLLSPACSSLDMFKNYIERGERFTTAVASLAKKCEVQT